MHEEDEVCDEKDDNGNNDEDNPFPGSFNLNNKIYAFSLKSLQRLTLIKVILMIDFNNLEGSS